MNLIVLGSALALLAGGPGGEASDAYQAGIDQIGASDAPGAAVQDINTLQLGDSRPQVDPAQPSPHPEPVSQLNADQPSVAPPEGGATVSPFQRPTQVNDQPATASAPPGPVVVAPRRTSVDVIKGDDACDPRSAQPGDDEVCAHRIETRADEFAPPPVDTSAEERLMAEREVNGANAQAVARDLARGDVQNSDAAQAYVFTSTLTASPPPSASVASPETQRAMDAAAQLLGGLPVGAIVSPR